MSPIRKDAREAGRLAPSEEVKADITEAVYAEKAGEILARAGRP